MNERKSFNANYAPTLSNTSICGMHFIQLEIATCTRYCILWSPIDVVVQEELVSQLNSKKNVKLL